MTKPSNNSNQNGSVQTDMPDPEVAPRVTHRQFTAAYKPRLSPKPLPAPRRVKSVPYCGEKGCTVRTCRTGGEGFSPAFHLFSFVFDVPGYYLALITFLFSLSSNSVRMNQP